jgi:hypothetical protein
MSHRREATPDASQSLAQLTPHQQREVIKCRNQDE